MSDITLNGDNVSDYIKGYLRKLGTMKLPDLSNDPTQLFETLKRGKVAGGPYPGRSLFECANRVLSDLVVLFAAEQLLRKPPEDLPEFREIVVRLGTNSGHDLEAKLPDGTLLLGECFNVASSFFPTKLADGKKKLRKANATYRVFAFNTDAGSARSARKSGWTYLPIDVRSELNRWSQQLGAQRTDPDR